MAKTKGCRGKGSRRNGKEKSKGKHKNKILILAREKEGESSLPEEVLFLLDLS